MDDLALRGLGTQADGHTQQRAAQYFEQLKESELGWQLSINALATHAYAGNDHVRFFCFQVVEHYVKTRYAAASETEQQSVRSFLLTWLQTLHNGGTAGNAASEEKGFILNKAAQVFVVACLCDYPDRWPTFFDDLIVTLRFGTRCVDMYLRILQAIDSDVIDRDIVHTTQELERNTRVKDAIRMNCVERLVDSWFQILVTYETSNPSLACSCLDVIGAYVSWIEISLIANERFVEVLLRFMSNCLLRESACDCIHEIISKGMDPVTKIKLIESFTSVLGSAGILSDVQDEDGDFLAKLSKLVNGMGLQLIQCWQKLSKTKDDAGTKLCLAALESKLPIMLRFLGNEDDDVSGCIIPFAHDYVSLLKRMTPLSEQHKRLVEEMLCVIINKMKYDESYSFGSEGEDEAMFEEYRKELRVMFNNIGALDGAMLLGVVHRAITSTLSRWQTASFQDIEVAITLLYQLGEALPASHSQHFTGDANKASALQELMRLLITSRVSCYRHPAVQLQFFETVIRYDRFFATEPQHIQELLTAFLDERGLWNNSSHVRSRASYLFSRFVKTINKVQLQPFLDGILQRIQELLVLDTPYNSSTTVGRKQYLSADDQQFMYETAGILIVQSQFSAEHKQELMKCLLSPIVSKFDELLQFMMQDTNPVRQLACASLLSQAMGFASRTSKGFSGQITVKQNGCTEAYVETLRVFLHVLNVPVHRPILHQGVRQFLHRMVVCLEEAILPFIPLAMESLLKQADVKELHDFIPFINQVIQKFKKDIAPFLQQVFMPIVSTIFQALTADIDVRDQVMQTERSMLQRGYFLFISTLVNNNVTEVLSSQSSTNLHQVLMTVIHGAVEIPDPTAQKTCFAILRKLVEIWGDENQSNGFDSFMYKNIVPACFMAPIKATFDFNDAQTILALNESADCLKAVHAKREKELVLYLQNDYLVKQSVALPLIQELCQALKSDNKTFRVYFKSFCQQAKSS